MKRSKLVIECGEGYMSEDEHIAMVEAGDRFWHEFSALCERYIAEAPERLRAEWTMYLGEKTSIYGREQ